MYLGCASVLQSIVTSVPDGAPTSWFGTNIIGETVFIHRSVVSLLYICVSERARESERARHPSDMSICLYVGAIDDGAQNKRTSERFSYVIPCFDWVASHMCVYTRVLVFWTIRCNAENTWEPKHSRYYNFCWIFFIVIRSSCCYFCFDIRLFKSVVVVDVVVVIVFVNAMMIQTSNRYNKWTMQRSE